MLSNFLNLYIRWSGNYIIFGNVGISVIFSSFFIITLAWSGDFEIWWFHQKDLVQIYQNISYFQYPIFSSILNMYPIFIKLYLYTTILRQKIKYLKFFENHNSKSVDISHTDAAFIRHIYELNTIYSWIIRIMCHVKIWKYIIAICSLVLRWWFLIRCAILVFIIKRFFNLKNISITYMIIRLRRSI